MKRSFLLIALVAGLAASAESHDVIVAGGGPAGIGAAYMAAKRGAKVLLLEKSGRLGGNAVQAMVSPFICTTGRRTFTARVVIDATGVGAGAAAAEAVRQGISLRNVNVGALRLFDKELPTGR